MFFTRIGKVIAHLIFWLSVFRLSAALMIAFGTPDMEENSNAAQYLLGATTSGEALNEATVGILLAVALGVLCEISSRKSKTDDQQRV